MTGAGPPWPLAIVTGFLGSGKTTLIGRLLRRPDMADTVVVVNEFGEVGLDHDLIRRVTDNVVLLANGCLCCTVRQDIVHTLRGLHRSWLADDMPDFGRVLVETTGLAEPAPLVASVCSNPHLAEAFVLSAVTTLVDAEYGLGQLDRHVTCRNQACAADTLVISKCDLAPAATVAALKTQLSRLNPVAVLRESRAGDDDGADLFRRDTVRPTRSALVCEGISDHLARISTLVLKAEKPLSWARFRIWLSEVLDESGDRVLRLKGRLTFDGAERPVIVQAVHHSFYPLVETSDPNDIEAFLVFIFDGAAPPRIAEGFERCQVG